MIRLTSRSAGRSRRTSPGPRRSSRCRSGAARRLWGCGRVACRCPGSGEESSGQPTRGVVAGPSRTGPLGRAAETRGSTLAADELRTAPSRQPSTGEGSSSEVHPAPVHVAQRALDDLRERLGRTRLPDAETVTDWSQGLPLAYARELLDTWVTDYDWRRVEDVVNSQRPLPHRHRRRRHPLPAPSFAPRRCDAVAADPRWPGSIIEFLGVIDALVDPTAHGGRAEDAFHVVVPSLPGYGSAKRPGPRGGGVTASRTPGWS